MSCSVDSLYGNEYCLFYLRSKFIIGTDEFELNDNLCCVGYVNKLFSFMFRCGYRGVSSTWLAGSEAASPWAAVVSQL
jgi:hypothetical protein